MPRGNFTGSGTISFVFGSRSRRDQQSSMTMYSYPASLSPSFTKRSAVSSTTCSLIFSPNVFQEFHPMGGVIASGWVMLISLMSSRFETDWASILPRRETQRKYRAMATSNSQYGGERTK